MPSKAGTCCVSHCFQNVQVLLFIARIFGWMRKHSLDHWIPFLAGINVLFLTYAFCFLAELCSFDQFFLKTYSRLNDAEHFFLNARFCFHLPPNISLVTKQPINLKFLVFIIVILLLSAIGKNSGTKPSVIHCQNVSEAAVLCWKKVWKPTSKI